MEKIIPKRKIEGVSAVLLPFHADNTPDFDGFVTHVERTCATGLTPAVNMDTGYASLLSPETRLKTLDLMAAVAGGRRFIAGALIENEPGDLVAHYTRTTDTIQQRGGTPILFQSTALTCLPADELVEAYRGVAVNCDTLLAFELSPLFASFGQIYSLEVIQELMQIPQITGLKHSSLKREPEWQRLELRNKIRPGFKIYTGNDLAIDMIMYGSDYLLGLTTFAPDYFALRDQYWLAGDTRFYELNDLLQYLGQYAFRAPITAYKHSAAQFLKLRGWIACDHPHPTSPIRPESDLPILKDILERLTLFD